MDEGENDDGGGGGGDEGVRMLQRGEVKVFIIWCGPKCFEISHLLSCPPADHRKLMAALSALLSVFPLPPPPSNTGLSGSHSGSEW